jgi:hypothetical protein
MTSLEDQILKKNVPGRYSTWKEDQNDKLSEVEGKKLGPLTLRQGNQDDGSDKDNDANNGDDDDDAEDWIDNEEDDEFMLSYRQQRLKEIQDQMQNQASSIAGPNQETHILPDLVIAAVVPEINGVEYVNLVNQQGESGEDESSLLILLFHDLSDPATVKVLQQLAHLCIRCRKNNPQFVTCKRLNTASTGKDIDPIILPALLIHQNGGLKHNLTPFLEHLPENFTPADLHRLLESCNVSLHGVASTDQDDQEPELEENEGS